MKVSIIEGTGIVKEQDNKVQEEADNHKVNETGKDKQKDGQQGMVLFCVQKESTDNAAPNGRNKPRRRRKKMGGGGGDEMLLTGKIRAVNTVRL
jgi:hypothetical protein